MPTKKAATKKRTTTKTSKKASKVRTGREEMYAPPIRDAIARGDLNEMRQLAKLARTHIREVQTALTSLEASIKKRQGG
jgi:uncharacterized protein DUF1843